MELCEYYNIPKSIGWDELSDTGAIESSHHEEKVQSEVVTLENLNNFLNKHHNYWNNYDYYMSQETFDLLCQDKGVRVNSILAPGDLYMHGLHILPVADYLKIGEILSIPQHDYEHFEPMLYG